jgi:hypothetical protein
MYLLNIHLKLCKRSSVERANILNLLSLLSQQELRATPNNQALVFTHFDYMRDFLELQRGYQMNKQEDRHRMANYLAAELAGTIRNHINKEPDIFITSTELGVVELDSKCHMRIPKYPMDEFYNIVNWIKKIYD